MRGRKPKPTHIKLVTGNPGKRAISGAEEVQASEPGAAPARPKFLKGRAAKLWDEYAPQLATLGVLTDVDAHMFATWCALAAELEKNPAAMTASRIAQMRALASSFGMDASARTRLGAGGAEKPKADPTAAYFGATG